VRYLWIALIVVSIVPSAVACFLLNPLVFLMLGPEAWHEQVLRVRPYRWWIAASLISFASATTVFARRYT
jgi:hypothetical protein